MTTQKDTLRIFKGTKGKLAVVAFDGEIRTSTYSGLDIIGAMKEIALKNQCHPELTCLIVNSKQYLVQVGTKLIIMITLLILNCLNNNHTSRATLNN